MSWQHWVIAAWFVLGVVVMPTGIGKPREPWTSNKAVLGIAFYGAFLTLLVWGQR